MKIYAGMIAYNEADHFLKPALESIYDYVDEIIVVDGSPRGPSTDETVDIAKSIGPKVKIISGCFLNPDKRSTDHKKIQRQTYLDAMEKGKNNWCLVHDADEVWDKKNIERLIEYLENADEANLLFSYQWIHIWRDFNHVLGGGNWSRPRNFGVFRLFPEYCQLNHHEVGILGNNERRIKDITLTSQKSPFRIILDDVTFYHYGQVMTFEKYLFKQEFYFRRDGHFREQVGYGENQWERYLEEMVVPKWNENLEEKHGQVVRFKGKHPIYMKDYLDRVYWKKQ